MTGFTEISGDTEDGAADPGMKPAALHAGGPIELKDAARLRLT